MEEVLADFGWKSEDFSSSRQCRLTESTGLTRKADVRVLDRSIAMRIFEGVLRFARSGTGDVVALQGEMAGALRLRIGDYRVLLSLEGDTMRIFGVRHRSQAYR